MAFKEHTFFPNISPLKFTATQFDGIIDDDCEDDCDFRVMDNKLFLNINDKNFSLIEKGDWLIQINGETKILSNNEFEIYYNTTTYKDVEKVLLDFLPKKGEYIGESDYGQGECFDFRKKHLLDCVEMIKAIFDNPTHYFTKYSELMGEKIAWKDNVIYQEEYRKTGQKVFNYILDNNLMTEIEICNLLKIRLSQFQKFKKGEVVPFYTDIITLCETFNLNYQNFQKMDFDNRLKDYSIQ